MQTLRGGCAADFHCGLHRHYAVHTPCFKAHSSLRPAQRPTFLPSYRLHSTKTDETVTSLDAGAGLNAATTKPASWQWEESDDALLAYSVLFAVLGLGCIPALHSNKLADLPYFISLAVCTIYIGAHRGLTTKQRQQISIKEGVLAPVAASVSLFGCYLLIKFFPQISLQTFLNGYFWLLGSFAGVGAFGPFLRRATGPLGQKSLSMNVPEGLLLDEEGKPVTKTEFAPSDILAIALAVGLSSWELSSNHTLFTLNNMMATLIATDILQLVGIRSFRTAALMLVGLLVYDVFWVFGSPKVVGDNVMLTVATSELITGPTRILFPRIPGGTGEASDFPYSLLGLGDIAIPGLLACLALRYDASRSTDMRGRAEAAIDAIKSALSQLPSDATRKEMGNAAASAAMDAFDRVADAELDARNRTVDGRNEGKSATPNTAGKDSGSTPSGADGSAAGSNAQGWVAALLGQGGSSNPQGQSEAAEPVVITDAVLQNRVYFTPVMVSYVAGLVAAFVANSVTNLGQPALLYIVPSTLLTVAMTGATRQELGRLWLFTDVPSFGVPDASKVQQK